MSVPSIQKTRKRKLEESEILYSDGSVRVETAVMESTRCRYQQIPLDLVSPVIEPTVRVNTEMLRLDWIKDWEGLVCAGGHVLNAIKEDWKASLHGDIDIFFVEPICTEVQVIAKLQQIHDWLAEAYRRCSVPISIKGSSVVFFVDDVLDDCVAEDNKPPKHIKVQVILLKCFAGVPELLRSFDLNNCQFAFQNGRISATVNALHYLRTSQIFEVANSLSDERSSRRRLRLAKYAERPYNKIVKCGNAKPLDVSSGDLIDYNVPHNSEMGARLYDFSLREVKLNPHLGPAFGRSFSIEQITQTLKGE